MILYLQQSHLLVCDAWTATFSTSTLRGNENLSPFLMKSKIHKAFLGCLSALACLKLHAYLRGILSLAGQVNVDTQNNG